MSLDNKIETPDHFFFFMLHKYVYRMQDAMMDNRAWSASVIQFQMEGQPLYSLKLICRVFNSVWMSQKPFMLPGRENKI